MVERLRSCSFCCSSFLTKSWSFRTSKSALMFELMSSIVAAAWHPRREGRKRGGRKFSGAPRYFASALRRNALFRSSSSSLLSTCLGKTMRRSTGLGGSASSSSPVRRAHGQGRGHFHKYSSPTVKDQQAAVGAYVTTSRVGSEHVTNT